ncbi:MAG: Molybdenum cofactor biosynthesis protein MoaE [uncultured Sulfurovum sp.]|uniref:Molybdopterin synthase catalytic subunit n=1 Tax=uncultured Sulfurovum sp. TaxID=269237 RepID=A0A6S6TL79_9BACT|nr:MAG: Molybdenum cofactor biosynthesis protein MoaE [uncultured Sulfurovum sp.]
MMEIKCQFYLLYVVDSLELYQGSLEVENIFSKWLHEESSSNYGAYIPFVGTIRAEDGIEALSFDIYEPVLEKWFNAWVERAEKRGAKVKMAHAIGDVPVHTSSYISAVFSPKRRVALELIDAFVEDFKANAPIWKYDVKDGQRIYAADRSTPMEGSGLLSK